MKQNKIPSFEKQVESCLKAGREGKLIEYNGYNLKNEQKKITKKSQNKV